MDYATPPLSTTQRPESNETDSSTANAVAVAAAVVAAASENVTHSALASFYDSHNQLGPIRHSYNSHLHHHNPYDPPMPLMSSNQQIDEQQGLYDSLAAAAALASGVPTTPNGMYYYDSNQQWQSSNWNNANFVAAAAQYAQFPPQQLPLGPMNNSGISQSALPLTNGFQNFGKIGLLLVSPPFSLLKTNLNLLIKIQKFLFKIRSTQGSHNHLLQIIHSSIYNTV